MKVLLLHPEDTLDQSRSAQRWDWIVDLGRAPAVTYERWARQAACRVSGLYDPAEEIEDLYQIRDSLRVGKGRIVDGWGIDWWEVLSLEIASDLQEINLLRRLAEDLTGDCEIYASRPCTLATALGSLLGKPVTILGNGFHTISRRLRHYSDAFSRLDAAQVGQVLEDKFDGEHALRRHFTRRPHNSDQPVVLLPSAYINVSRTALSFAVRLPGHHFLLMLTRRNGKPSWLPPNVHLGSLTPYFTVANHAEIKLLLRSWGHLKSELGDCDPLFRTAQASGVLARFPGLLRWGIAFRDAWIQVFNSQNVVGCLSADDSNPPTLIPLLLARQRGVPALACHHGALDYRMAIKTHCADFYLAKNDMERDYLRRICQVPSEKIVAGAPEAQTMPPRNINFRGAPWLVFFTEPYQEWAWRSDEIYRDLLPRLYQFAESCALKLVFKLHPFESVKAHRRILRRYLGTKQSSIQIIAGPLSPELWQNMRFAITVQSSVALECAAANVPVFLCGWMRDAYSGYLRQFQRFGIGQVLDSPDQIAQIPLRLATHKKTDGVQPEPITNEEFSHLLSGDHALAVGNHG